VHILPPAGLGLYRAEAGAEPTSEAQGRVADRAQVGELGSGGCKPCFQVLLAYVWAVSAIGQLPRSWPLRAITCMKDQKCTSVAMYEQGICIIITCGSTADMVWHAYMVMIKVGEIKGPGCGSREVSWRLSA
jgi:hypothetical protein